jgi:hypothetical protein
MKKIVALGLFSTIILLVAGTVSAASVKEILAQKYENDKDICPGVKSCVSEGLDTREVVKIGILMGNHPCYVVRCALDAGARMEPTLEGAIEAGARTDVVARCADAYGYTPRDQGRPDIVPPKPLPPISSSRP